MCYISDHGYGQVPVTVQRVAQTSSDEGQDNILYIRKGLKCQIRYQKYIFDHGHGQTPVTVQRLTQASSDEGHDNISYIREGLKCQICS